MKSPLPPPPRDYQKSHQLIGGWLHRHHLSCQHFTEFSFAVADRPLALGEKFRRMVHFLICSVCRKFSKQIKVLRHLVKLHVTDLAKTPPSAEFLQTLRDRLATQVPSGENSSTTDSNKTSDG